MTKREKLVAVAIQVDGFDPMAACAESVSKARYLCWKSAQEAGYTTVTFGRIRSQRCPRLDAWAEQQDRPQVVSLSHAEEMSRPTP